MGLNQQKLENRLSLVDDHIGRSFAESETTSRAAAAHFSKPSATPMEAHIVQGFSFLNIGSLSPQQFI
jgi:hypothetical protein